MKNLFGFLIKDKNVWPLPEPDGSEFIVKRAEEEVKLRLSAMDREDDTIQKAANFPPWLTHLFGIMLMCGALLFVVAIELLGEDEMDYEFAVSCGFWYFIGFGGGLTLISALFFLIQTIKRKSVLNSSAVKEHENRYEKIKREALESMLVPQGAVPVDVLSYPYRIRNGKRKGVMTDVFANLPLYAFRDGEAFCLADDTYVVRIPYESVVSLSCVRKRTMFIGWNKGEKFNKGAFKSFKIRCNSYGQLFVKPKSGAARRLKFSFRPMNLKRLHPCSVIRHWS